MEEKYLYKLICFINHLADLSEDVIFKYYRNFGTTNNKKDGSPVTIADKKAEKIMRDAINSNFPDHGIIGEEFGIKNPKAQYKWVIDPIDGTSSFVIGRAMFTTLIAVLYNDTPIIGLINQPILKERWLGVKGKKTVFNGKRIKVRRCTNLKKSVLLTTAPHYYKKHDLAKFNRLAKQTALNVYGGDSYGYALVASGFADIAVDASLKPHDYLPLIPVIEGTGGIISDWQGNKLDINSNGNILITGSKKLHKDALSILGRG